MLTSKIIERYIEINDVKDELKLNQMNMQGIKPNAFKNCRNRNIRSLCLKGRNERNGYRIPLTRQHSSLFEPLKEHLEELDVSCILKCDFNFLEHLTNLRKLKINVNCKTIWRPMFKQANNQLVYLDLSGFYLTINYKKMFNDLKCLKYLDLSYVKLADNVLPDLFKEIRQLETLKVIDTQFKPADDSFIHLENLRELHFVGIKIK